VRLNRSHLPLAAQPFTLAEIATMAKSVSASARLPIRSTPICRPLHKYHSSPRLFLRGVQYIKMCPCSGVVNGRNQPWSWLSGSSPARSHLFPAQSGSQPHFIFDSWMRRLAPLYGCTAATCGLLYSHQFAVFMCRSNVRGRRSFSRFRRPSAAAPPLPAWIAESAAIQLPVTGTNCR